MGMPGPAGKKAAMALAPYWLMPTPWPQPVPVMVIPSPLYVEPPGCYHYTIHYTYSQLSKRLKDKGYSIGTVCEAYVSKTTPTGNVAEITFKDTAGKTWWVSASSPP